MSNIREHIVGDIRLRRRRLYKSMCVCLGVGARQFSQPLDAVMLRI